MIRKSGNREIWESGNRGIWTSVNLEIWKSFIRNGFERLNVLVRTGSLDRPDILIAVPAAIATAGLVVGSIVGYSRIPDKSWKDASVFGAALALVPAYFIGIFAVFAPQYLGMFRRLVH